MNNQLYSLEATPNHPCPRCNELTWRRYVDNVSGGLMPEAYGRCNNGDHQRIITQYEPYRSRDQEYRYGFVLPGSFRPVIEAPLPDSPAFGVYPDFILERTLGHYEENYLLCFLAGTKGNFAYPFPLDDVLKCAGEFKLGTMIQPNQKDNYNYFGGTTFPLTDILGQVRAILIQCYDEKLNLLEGSRGSDFLHKIFERRLSTIELDYHRWLEQYRIFDTAITCLFGEHLLAKFPNNPVRILNDPRDAIIATLYYGFPDDGDDVPIWLACSGIENMTAKICRVLKGRTVKLYPNLSPDGETYKKWEEVANELRERVPGIDITVSRGLEILATPEQRAKSLGIADALLLPYDWRHTRLTLGEK